MNSETWVIIHSMGRTLTVCGLLRLILRVLHQCCQSVETLCHLGERHQNEESQHRSKVQDKKCFKPEVVAESVN